MMSATRFEDGDEVRSHVGKEVCVTDWMTIGQERIDLFAQATGDFQWIHVDVERSAKSSPYGGTIAHGFLTLSLLGKFYEDYLGYALPFCDMGINYGLNKVRFTSPVPAGSKVRARTKLLAADPMEGGGIRLTNQVTMEIEGQERPVCVAETMSIVYGK